MNPKLRTTLEAVCQEELLTSFFTSDGYCLIGKVTNFSDERVTIYLGDLGTVEIYADGIVEAESVDFDKNRTEALRIGSGTEKANSAATGYERVLPVGWTPKHELQLQEALSSERIRIHQATLESELYGSDKAHEQDRWVIEKRQEHELSTLKFSTAFEAGGAYPAGENPIGALREFHEDDMGNIRHYCDGQLHRDNGPALIFASGEVQFYRKGELHREDGPALILASGEVQFYLSGEKLTKADYERTLFGD